MPKNYAYRFVAKTLVVSLLSSTMIHAFSDDILEKQLSTQYQSFSKLRTVTLNPAISPTVQFVQHLMQTPDDYLARKLALLIGKGAGVGGVGQREATEEERRILFSGLSKSKEKGGKKEDFLSKAAASSQIKAHQEYLSTAYDLLPSQTSPFVDFLKNNTAYQSFNQKAKVHHAVKTKNWQELATELSPDITNQLKTANAQISAARQIQLTEYVFTLPKTGTDRSQFIGLASKLLKAGKDDYNQEVLKGLIKLKTSAERQKFATQVLDKRFWEKDEQATCLKVQMAAAKLPDSLFYKLSTLHEKVGKDRLEPNQLSLVEMVASIPSRDQESFVENISDLVSYDRKGKVILEIASVLKGISNSKQRAEFVFAIKGGYFNWFEILDKAEDNDYVQSLSVLASLPLLEVELLYGQFDKIHNWSEKGTIFPTIKILSQVKTRKEQQELIEQALMMSSYADEKYSFNALKVLADTPERLRFSFIEKFLEIEGYRSSFNGNFMKCLSDYSGFKEREVFVDKFINITKDFRTYREEILHQITKIPVDRRLQIINQAYQIMGADKDSSLFQEIVRCLSGFNNEDLQKFTKSLPRLLVLANDKSSLLKKIGKVPAKNRSKVVEQAVHFIDSKTSSYYYEGIIGSLRQINENDDKAQSYIQPLSSLLSSFDDGDKSSLIKEVAKISPEKRKQIIEKTEVIGELIEVRFYAKAADFLEIMNSLSGCKSDLERDSLTDLAVRSQQFPNMDKDAFFDLWEVVSGVAQTDQGIFVDNLSSILPDLDNYNRRQVLLPMKRVAANNRLNFVQFLNDNQVEKKEHIDALAGVAPDAWETRLERLREDARKYSSYSVKEVKTDQVYKKLDNQAVRVNRAALSKWKLPEIQMAPYTADQMQKTFANIVKGLNLTDATRPDYVSASLLDDSSLELKGTANRDKFYRDILPQVSGFLKTLWGVSLSGNETLGWQMYDDNKPAFRKALSYILEQMTQADAESRMMLLNQLVNGLLHCPTGQKEAVDTVVQSLVSQTLVNAETFQQKLDQFLAVKKNEAFRRTMISGNNTQNVHIMSYYHEKLGKTLGLSSSLGDFKERIGRMGHDPFSGYEGNALQAFYQTFNPTYLTDAFHSHAQTKKDFALHEELETLKGKVRREKDNAKKDQLSTQLNTLKQKYTQITRTDRPFTATMVYNDLMEKGKMPTDSSDGWEKYFSDDPIMSTDSFELTKAGARQYLIDSGLLLEKAK